MTLPFQPPEEYDSDFTAIHGYCDMKVPQQVVTENVLDMLHINTVHSFGNPKTLARSVKYEILREHCDRG